MPEILQKLRPDRDLQCYFERPSAIAALSEASADGFTLSGCWRQQFDWAVIEWNRDNVYEHPLFRNLPDGDLSGLKLSYQETRTNCIPIDSVLYSTVDWPYLRVWSSLGGSEVLYRVPLRNYAVPVEGDYAFATAEFELRVLPGAGEYVGLAWPGEHHTYQTYWNDSIESAAQAIAESINSFSQVVRATRIGGLIRLTYTDSTGHNGNRFGAYAYATGSGQWDRNSVEFSGGQSPSTWQVDLDFANLRDVNGQIVPTNAVRKMRWTYSADLQAGAFERSEFAVHVSRWQVTGTGRSYRVPGPGSLRVEDDSPDIEYAGPWQKATGNYSGGSIHHVDEPGGSARCTYSASGNHELNLGTRLAASGATIEVSVDDAPPSVYELRCAGEDSLVRLPLGKFGAGTHSVRAVHRDSGDSVFYFDFIEAAVPVDYLPAPPPNRVLALATDWDTDHSIALPAERTAWMITSMGFFGRVNHYVGAMWFYELLRKGHQYASAAIEFSGTPVPSEITSIVIGRSDRAPEDCSILRHLNHAGDTGASIAKAFEIEINNGYTGIRATSEGSELQIFSRSMGQDGNRITLAASPTEGAFQATVTGPLLAGGEDGEWITDLIANPRLNRAARDWCAAFYRTLQSSGMDSVAAFSTELQHGDSSVVAGIAQRYPSGGAVLLNTPALQTNFSPESLAYWKQVYDDMAQLMASSGVTPYLQFGEVQWWYFPSDGTGMPFYDEYTRGLFFERYGRDMRIIADGTADPAEYAEEMEFLPKVIGTFTDAIIDHVRVSQPDCRFEVLYPTDVNEGRLARIVNYPAESWTPERIDSLKTESFTYTLSREMNKARESIQFGRELGFSRDRKSHLIGVSSAPTAWLKEARLAEQAGMESVVLFALDQLCLLGYPLPLRSVRSRSSSWN